MQFLLAHPERMFTTGVLKACLGHLDRSPIISSLSDVVLARWDTTLNPTRHSHTLNTSGGVSIACRIDGCELAILRSLLILPLLRKDVGTWCLCARAADVHSIGSGSRQLRPCLN